MDRRDNCSVDASIPAGIAEADGAPASGAVGASDTQGPAQAVGNIEQRKQLEEMIPEVPGSSPEALAKRADAIQFLANRTDIDHIVMREVKTTDEGYLLGLVIIQNRFKQTLSFGYPVDNENSMAHRLILLLMVCSTLQYADEVSEQVLASQQSLQMLAQAGVSGAIQ